MRTTAALLALLLSGCTPFTVALKAPPVRPDEPQTLSPLMRPHVSEADCLRLTFEDGEWARVSWDFDLDLSDQPTDSIRAQEPHPLAPMGVSDCRHVALPPALWAMSKQAVESYPAALVYVGALEDYVGLLLGVWESESVELAKAGKRAQVAQWRAAAVGAGVGAGVVLGIVLAVVLGTQ